MNAYATGISYSYHMVCFTNSVSRVWLGQSFGRRSNRMVFFKFGEGIGNSVKNKKQTSLSKILSSAAWADALFNDTQWYDMSYIYVRKIGYTSTRDYFR